MFIYLILIFICIIFIITYIFIRRNYEYYDNIKPEIPKNQNKLPISPNYSSNYPLKNYSKPLFVEPQRYEELDDKEEIYAGVQPPDSYFDILDINCTQPFKRPWACLLIKGNYVNNIPRKYCKEVCPDKFQEEEIESFKNFTDKPFPSHYYCYNFCKKGCTKHKYNPLEPHKNSCGQNSLSQIPLPVFLSEDKCMEESLPCKNLTKDKCLRNPQCGWCTNGIGQGVCFRSTPEGTFNVKLPCQPSRQKPTNAFKPGRLDPFKGVVQFLPLASFQK